MSTKPFWNPGEKSRLAEAAKLKLCQVTDVIAKRINVSVKRAQRLEAASLLVLGDKRVIPAAAWLRLDKHPALDD